MRRACARPHARTPRCRDLGLPVLQHTAELCDGGQVTMPMQPCFWAKAFGMCVDRYGVNWMVNGEQQPC